MAIKKIFRKSSFQPAVIGVFRSSHGMNQIIEELMLKKIAEDDITVLRVHGNEFIDIPIHKDLLVGAHTGAFIGTILGAFLSILCSLGVINLPGYQTFREVGAFLSALAGGAIGFNAGAVAGIIVGYLAAKIEQRRILSFMEQRGIALSIKTEDPKLQLIAKGVMVNHGAVKIYNPRQLRSDGPYVFNKSKTSSAFPI